jgi:hypothetical protein
MASRAPNLVEAQTVVGVTKSAGNQLPVSTKRNGPITPVWFIDPPWSCKPHILKGLAGGEKRGRLVLQMLSMQVQTTISVSKPLVLFTRRRKTK